MEDEVLDILQALSSSNDKNNRDSVKGRDVRKPGDLPNPILKSQEVRRTFNIGTILAEAFFKAKEKDTKDTFGATSTTPAAKASQDVLKAEEKKKKPFKFPLLATLAIGITAFATWIADFLGPVGEFISKTLPKLFKPMANMAKGFFTAIKGGKLITTLKGIAGKMGAKLLKFGRFIPVLGSLFSFGFGIARWKKGEYMPAIFEFASGLLNLLPTGAGNLASAIIDGALLLYDLNKTQKKADAIDPTGQKFDMWGKIRMYFLGAPGIQNIISLGKGIGAIFRGQWKEAGGHFLKSIPVIGNIIYWIDKAESGNVYAQEMVGNVKGFFIHVKDKVFGVVKNMVDGILSWIGETTSNIGDFLGDTIGYGVNKLKDIGSGALSLLPFVDDFMVRGDKVIPFNKKDDVIGLKSGGILGDVFKGFRSAVDTAWNFVGKGSQNLMGTDKIVGEIRTSNVHLGQLVQLTAQLVAGQGQASSQVVPMVSPPTNNDMSGGMEGPAYNDSRFDYTNSAYSMSTT